VGARYRLDASTQGAAAVRSATRSIEIDDPRVVTTVDLVVGGGF
jgi:hypothetical protein